MVSCQSSVLWRDCLKSGRGDDFDTPTGLLVSPSNTRAQKSQQGYYIAPPKQRTCHDLQRPTVRFVDIKQNQPRQFVIQARIDDQTRPTTAERRQICVGESPSPPPHSLDNNVVVPVAPIRAVGKLPTRDEPRRMRRWPGPLFLSYRTQPYPCRGGRQGPETS